jgi:hypothetical protein
MHIPPLPMVYRGSGKLIRFWFSKRWVLLNKKCVMYASLIPVKKRSDVNLLRKGEGGVRKPNLDLLSTENRKQT